MYLFVRYVEPDGSLYTQMTDSKGQFYIISYPTDLTSQTGCLQPAFVFIMPVYVWSIHKNGYTYSFARVKNLLSKFT